MKDTTQKVAIITGITKGIGLAIAQSFAAEGIFIVGASRNVQATTEICAQLRSLHKIECLAVPTDVSQKGEVQNLINKTIKEFGRIDILINNAAIGVFDTIKDFELEDWETMIDINLKGVFLCTQSVLPSMLRQGHGHIFNISSVCGLRGYAQCGPYCASKFGVNGLTEALFQEVKVHGIKVFAICPDIVDTSFADNINASITDKTRKLHPQDVSDCINNLIKRESPSQICEIRLKAKNFWQRLFFSLDRTRKVQIKTVKYL